MLTLWGPQICFRSWWALSMLWSLWGDICSKYCFLIFTNTKSKVQICQCFFKHRVTLTGWMNCRSPGGSLLWLQQIVAYILQLSGVGGGVAERSWDRAESFWFPKQASQLSLIWFGVSRSRGRLLYAWIGTDWIVAHSQRVTGPCHRWQF